MRVAVLGCGPAGLMATHAAAIAGAEDIRVFSKKRKSGMYGSQYLHAPIPGVTQKAPVTVKYELKGTVEEYRRKVYGKQWDGEVSPEDLLGEHEAWDIRDTYNTLWEMYGRYVIDADINPGFMAIEFNPDGDLYDAIISTVPRVLMCRYGHTFASQDVWAVGDAPERGLFAPFGADERNKVICNGEEFPSWYRASTIFGHNSVEWSLPHRPPYDGVTKVSKPLFTNCSCFPNIIYAGRYGTWRKGVLSHEAYQTVMDRLLVEPVST